MWTPSDGQVLNFLLVLLLAAILLSYGDLVKRIQGIQSTIEKKQCSKIKSEPDPEETTELENK